MNNYSYLMSRSGYRSFMDAPQNTVQSIPVGGGAGRTIITENEPVLPTVGTPVSHQALPLPPRPRTPAEQPEPESQNMVSEPAERPQMQSAPILNMNIDTELVTPEEETTNPQIPARTLAELNAAENWGTAELLTPTPRPMPAPMSNNTVPNRAENWGASNMPNNAADWNTSTPRTDMSVRTPQDMGMQMWQAGMPTDIMNNIEGLPEAITNPVFMPGYLRTQMGKPMHVEFASGDTMAERTGVLMQVGADYIVLAIPDKGMHTVCNIAHIKSITILEQNAVSPARSSQRNWQ